MISTIGLSDGSPLTNAKAEISRAACRRLFPAGVGAGNAPVGGPGGAVVGVGGLAEYPAAQRGGSHVQSVARGPGRVGGGSRAGPGEARICAAASSAARAACSQIASAPGSEPVTGRGTGPVQRWRSLGQVRSAASLPPPYHTGPPSLAVSPGSATAYPVTWPGLRALNRLRTSTPALPRRAKNSSSLPAPAAAVLTPAAAA